jgi:hypothetical protein
MTEGVLPCGTEPELLRVCGHRCRPQLRSVRRAGEKSEKHDGRHIENAETKETLTQPRRLEAGSRQYSVPRPLEASDQFLAESYRRAKPGNRSGCSPASPSKQQRALTPRYGKTPNGCELSGRTRRQAPLSRRARRVLLFARGVTDGVLPSGTEPARAPRVRTPVRSAAANC